MSYLMMTRPIPEPTEDPLQFLTLQQVCALTQKSENTIRKWVELSQFPAPKRTPDGRPMWERSTIKRWLESLPS